MKEKRSQAVAGCLVWKILLATGVNCKGLKIALNQAWRTVRHFKIESLGSNIFMFNFSLGDNKVLNKGSWHFDRALIVLQETSSVGSIKKQSFSHASF